ncbi:MAG: hypothetical protein QM785_16610 [Pyrinomonadaceae bacterium]
MIETDIPLIDEILSAHKNELGKDLAGYRNHVYRMVNFCFLQGEFDAEQREKIVIAGSFHDLGIWTADTFDYLPPSVDLAMEYLDRNGLNEWNAEICEMIDLHHRVRHNADPLAEIFRKGDLVDFSLGLLKCGVPAEHVRAVRREFPNHGFHKQLVRRAGRWFCRHPLNPVPVLKW